MIYTTFFSTLSLAVIYGFSILLVLASLAVGNFFGRRSARNGKIGETSIGSAVAATLGLLAFMLAFTFNMAADRFSLRKTLLLNEANALSTAFLRADLLPADDRDRVRTLIAEYVDLRDIDPLHVPDFEERLLRTEAIQQELWQLVAKLSASGYDGERLRGFYDTLNEVIDFNTARLYTGMRYQIPPPIWGALYALTALAMFGIGFQLGASRSGSAQVAVALALAFSVVIVLIVDLDRSYEGVLLVEQTPMSELNARLQAAERAPRDSAD
ncbi:DUF4239 domain-containing protein [Microbulbifer marinus]|uniref:DUF4239 domain-containing protein n=1 Tax=Microbulbifer marinus TaxID=658218 RepID=A0A1H3YSQ9_9GAMM|nr:DUF4239 domain-containing protein [Microbulbifer marinus]SEA14576.1 Protein of unknown function [Microbulbifer marinus]